MRLTLLLALIWLALVNGCDNNPAQRPTTMISPKPAKTESMRATRPKKPQTRCPVMGGEIDRNIYVDVKGKRIYVCCRGCDDAIRAEPDIYLRKIEKAGVALEDTPP